MRTIVTTVGTSLLNNAKRDLGPNAAQPTEPQLANYLRHTEARTASAETNSLSRLLQEGDFIAFLCSHTEEGKRCADALSRHYASANRQSRVIEVADLTYSESRFKMRGLRSLVAKLIEVIRDERRKQRSVVVNATGGFKAEIAYATVVGLLFDVPVYYIHEAFNDIIEMPPTPISWDYSLLADFDEFFQWLAEDYRPSSEAEARLKALPSEVHLLLAEEDGFTFLSPVGEAFYESFHARLDAERGVPILLSSQARATYERTSPEIRRSFDRTLQKLRLPELRRSNADRVHNSDCLVFPKGHRPERIFFFEGSEGRVHVCEVSRHNDQSYERLLTAGVHRKQYTQFSAWEGTYPATA